MIKIPIDPENIQKIIDQEEAVLYYYRKKINEKFSSKLEEFGCSIEIKLIWSDSEDFETISDMRPELSSDYHCNISFTIMRDGRPVFFADEPYYSWDFNDDETPVSRVESDKIALCIYETEELNEKFNEDEGVYHRLGFMHLQLENQIYADIDVEHIFVDSDAVNIKISLPIVSFEKNSCDDRYLEIFKRIIIDKWDSLSKSDGYKDIPSAEKDIKIDYNNESFRINFRCGIEYYNECSDLLVESLTYIRFKELDKNKEIFVKAKKEIIEESDDLQGEHREISDFQGWLDQTTYKIMERMVVNWFDVEDMNVVIESGDKLHPINFKAKLAQLMFLDFEELGRYTKKWKYDAIRIVYDRKNMPELAKREDEVYDFCYKYLQRKYASRFSMYNYELNVFRYWDIFDNDDPSKFLYERPFLSSDYSCNLGCEITQDGEPIFIFKWPDIFEELEARTHFISRIWFDKKFNEVIQVWNKYAMKKDFHSVDGFDYFLIDCLDSVRAQDETEIKIDFIEADTKNISVKATLPLGQLLKNNFNSGHLEIIRELIYEQWDRHIKESDNKCLKVAGIGIRIDYDDRNFNIEYNCRDIDFRDYTKAFIEATFFFILYSKKHIKKWFKVIKENVMKKVGSEGPNSAETNRLCSNIANARFNDINEISEGWIDIENMKFIVSGGACQDCLDYFTRKIKQMSYLDLSFDYRDEDF